MFSGSIEKTSGMKWVKNILRNESPKFKIKSTKKTDEAGVFS